MRFGPYPLSKNNIESISNPMEMEWLISKKRQGGENIREINEVVLEKGRVAITGRCRWEGGKGSSAAKKSAGGVGRGGKQLWRLRKLQALCFFLRVPSSQRWISLVLLLKLPLVVVFPTR